MIGRRKPSGCANYNPPEAAEAEETYNDAIKRTLEKTDALEKHVKTVIVRADSLAALLTISTMQLLLETPILSCEEVNIYNSFWVAMSFRMGTTLEAHFSAVESCFFPAS